MSRTTLVESVSRLGSFSNVETRQAAVLLSGSLLSVLSQARFLLNTPLLLLVDTNDICTQERLAPALQPSPTISNPAIRRKPANQRDLLTYTCPQQCFPSSPKPSMLERERLPTPRVTESKHSWNILAATPFRWQQASRAISNPATGRPLRA